MKLRHRLIALLSPRMRGKLGNTKLRVQGFVERRSEARALKRIRMLLTADPLQGDYCLSLQEPFDARDDAQRSEYCLEARTVGGVCPTQCKWGLRVASNRTRAKAVQAERERLRR